MARLRRLPLLNFRTWTLVMFGLLTGLVLSLMVSAATPAPCASAAARCPVGASNVFSGTLGIQDGQTFTITIDVGGELAADRTATLPLLTGNDTFVFAAHAATFTNKTFDANGTGNSLSNVDVADLANGTDGELITWDAAAAPATVAAGTSGQVLTSNGAGAAPTFKAAGGGGTLVKAADETVNNSSTLQNDDDLTFSVLANTNYAIDLFLVIDTTAVADAKLNFTAPSGATWDMLAMAQSNTGTLTTFYLGDRAGDLGLDGNGYDRFIIMRIKLVNGANAGSFTLQWSQRTAEVSNTVMREGSWLKHSTD